MKGLTPYRCFGTGYPELVLSLSLGLSEGLPRACRRASIGKLSFLRASRIIIDFSFQWKGGLGQIVVPVPLNAPSYLAGVSDFA